MKTAVTPGIFLEPEERFVLPPGVEIRRVSDRGIDLTKVSEGFRSRLYNDAAGYPDFRNSTLIFAKIEYFEMITR